MELQTMVTMLAEGFVKSVAIFALTLIGSLPLGLLVTFGRMSKFKPLQWIVKLYISIMRGTPLMLQLMVVFFGPYYLFRIQVGSNYRFIAVIIGFVLNYAAYFAEIYRGGIESMSVGQYEAAEIMGYSKLHTFVRIILPQVIKRILPSITNEMITLVKDTSLAFAISYAEMFTLAQKIASSQSTLMPFVIAGVFYFVFNYVVAFIMERVEKKMSYYR
ncbi:MAG: amino acid ABC transporter permease [Ruminococcaceae bacterium]|nr:amino acid ABC transporter permease [Oscillospiraceae bacterium]